jgi:peptidoglycan/xylan/chitin deacetylase (PgdA/CDA1 family)
MTTIEEKLLAQRRVLNFLWSLSDIERSAWIERLMDRLETEDRPEEPDLMLTWPDVRHMHCMGITFGSHTVTHPILSRLSIDRAREEIEVSKRVIEEKLKAPISVFAYPNGRRDDFDEISKGLLVEAGYVCAVTTILGTNQPGQDLYELRRGGPWQQYLPAFATQLSWQRFWAVW